jgi:hypothetical protein
MVYNAYSWQGRPRMRYRSKAVLERGAASDLWRHTLSQIATVFGRLVYLNSLRDQITGKYEHHGLGLIFGEKQAATALKDSHRRAFEEWLGFTLEQQKADLDLYLSELVEDKRPVIEHWISSSPYRNLPPKSARPEEKALFLADLEALLWLLKNEYGVSCPDPDA